MSIDSSFIFDASSAVTNSDGSRGAELLGAALTEDNSKEERGNEFSEI